MYMIVYVLFSVDVVWNARGGCGRLAEKYSISTLHKKQQTSDLVLAGLFCDNADFLPRGNILPYHHLHSSHNPRPQ